MLVPQTPPRPPTPGLEVVYVNGLGEECRAVVDAVVSSTIGECKLTVFTGNDGAPIATRVARFDARNVGSTWHFREGA